jgi:hypothetical protein
MAIVVQEEQKSGLSIMSLLIWLSVLLAIGGSAYYVFFKNPQLVGDGGASDARAEIAAQLSKVKANADELLKNQKYASLKDNTPPLNPQNKGRTNPFLAFPSANIGISK